MKHLIKLGAVLLMMTFCGFRNNPSQNDGNIKVMTYNIWNGFDWGKDTVRRDNFIQWIQSKDLDVLALQELCGYDEEKLKKDAEKWGHNYAVILKNDGYPVGITSKRPIVLREKIREGLWHGMLHCETYGIDFFIVHLSPADVNYRFKESTIITNKVIESNSKKFIILGDFNSHSPFDADLNKERPDLYAKYAVPQSDGKYSNLRLEEYDYSVISKFLALPAIDVSMKHVNPKDRYSFPSPVLIGSYRTQETVETTKERIDYILASPALAKMCTGSVIFNKWETRSFSDHYPVMATFDLDK